MPVGFRSVSDVSRQQFDLHTRTIVCSYSSCTRTHHIFVLIMYSYGGIYPVLVRIKYSYSSRTCIFIMYSYSSCTRTHQYVSISRNQARTLWSSRGARPIAHVMCHTAISQYSYQRLLVNCSVMSLWRHTAMPAGPSGYQTDKPWLVLILTQLLFRCFLSTCDVSMRQHCLVFVVIVMYCGHNSWPGPLSAFNQPYIHNHTYILNDAIWLCTPVQKLIRLTYAGWCVHPSVYFK